MQKLYMRKTAIHLSEMSIMQMVRLHLQVLRNLQENVRQKSKTANLLSQSKMMQPAKL